MIGNILVVNKWLYQNLKVVFGWSITDLSMVCFNPSDLGRQSSYWPGNDPQRTLKLDSGILEFSTSVLPLVRESKGWTHSSLQLQPQPQPQPGAQGCLVMPLLPMQVMVPIAIPSTTKCPFYSSPWFTCPVFTSSEEWQQGLPKKHLETSLL